MNTRKHLNIIYGFIGVLIMFSLIGTFICLIAAIAGENALPLLICAILSIVFYFSMVFLRVIIDFYDAVVVKHQLQTAILNAIDECDTNSQE